MGTEARSGLVSSHRGPSLVLLTGVCYGSVVVELLFQFYMIRIVERT